MERVVTRLHRGPPRPERTDGEWLAQLADGDLAALGVLYDRHYSAVLRFVQRIVRNDVEDVAQETFLLAARIAHNFDGRANCRPWLFGIAARIVMQRGRTGARLARFLGRLSLEPTPAPASPYEFVERGELRSTLARALDRLTPAKRVVLVMAEGEGLTCEQIAEALDIPTGTVWTRLYHARRELRAQLSRGEP